MKKMKNVLAVALALVLTAGTLAGCNTTSNDDNKDEGTTTESAEATDSAATTEEATESTDQADGDAFDFYACIASEPEYIDPALNTAVDGAIIINHVFEGLMKWEDDGEGNAVLAKGQIKDYEMEELTDGMVLYKITLRDDIKWSDGQDVVAEDFVYGLQRLVTPETAADYNYMADMIVNAKQIMDGSAEPSELGVVAKSEKELEISLTYDCPYFLELLAFPALMPVRKDIVEANPDNWTRDPATYVGNGSYKMEEWVHNATLKLVPNEHYYDAENLGPDSITFKLMDDNNAILADFNSGGLDFIEEMPVDEVPTLLESGKLNVVDYIGTYYVSFNNEVEPFNDARVREAFTLAIDRNYIVEEITRTGQKPATGFVPSGVNDATEDGDDFRTVGGEYYSVDPAEYEANCARAKELLAEAGYPDGAGFPIVEYLYNTNDNHRAIGEALQDMWSTVLGVTVTLNNQDWNVFIDSRDTGAYQICRHGWIADYNDPISFLDLFISSSIDGNNSPRYNKAEFDALIEEAKSTSDPAARMSAMHKAEDLAIGEDYTVAPVYFYTQKYMLNEDVEGMFYTPLGYFFFNYLTTK